MKRSVNTLKSQLENGRYRPVLFEQPFERKLDTGTVIKGTIDRIDTAEEEDATYVKIIDYKSGQKDFDESLFHAGVRLQTAVYLSEAIRAFKKKNPDTEFKPGAMFYYHMFDPILATNEEDERSVEKLRGEEMRPLGIFVNDEKNLELLEPKESRSQGKSPKVPVSYKADLNISGTPKKAVSEEAMNSILSEADDKVKELSEAVLEGEIAVSPIYEPNGFDACAYCGYKGACGFDGRAYGYKKRSLDGNETDAGEDDGTDDGGDEE